MRVCVACVCSMCVHGCVGHVPCVWHVMCVHAWVYGVCLSRPRRPQLHEARISASGVPPGTGTPEHQLGRGRTALSPRSLGGPSFAGAANALQRGEKLLPVEARQTLRPLGAVPGTQGTLQTGSPFRSQHGSTALLSADVRGPAVSSHTEPPPVAAPRSLSSMVTSPAL